MGLPALPLHGQLVLLHSLWGQPGVWLNAQGGGVSLKESEALGIDWQNHDAYSTMLLPPQALLFVFISYNDAIFSHDIEIHTVFFVLF